MSDSASSVERERVYSRRVSFNEKLYLAEETFNPGFCIQLVLEEKSAKESVPEAAPLSEEAFSGEALASAVARAAEANPGSRLVYRGVLGWARWVAEGPVPPVRVVRDPRDRPDWAEDGPPPEVARPLPFDVGPTCEVVLVRSSRAPARIVFRCFHGVMDGRGLLHFAEEVFRALRGEALVGSPCTQNDTEIVTAMVGKKKRPLLKSDCPLIHTPPSPEEHRGPSASAPRGVVWNAIVLEGAIPGLVAKISAFLARRAEESRGEHGARTRIMIPVDLRNYKRDLQSVGNMSYPLFIDVSPKQTWSDIQRSILKRLAAKEPMRLDPFEGILPWLPLWLFGIIYLLWIGAQRRSGEYPFSALVTHLALQTIAPLRCDRFEAETPYFLPPDSDFVPLTIAAVTSASRAMLVVSAPRSLMAAPALMRLCDALRAALASPP